MCKCRKALSWPILIGRGLILIILRICHVCKSSKITSPLFFVKRFYAVVNLFDCIYLAAFSAVYISIVVTIALRSHLFSFRTQKLSSAAPKVLVGQPTGRIGCCHFPLSLWFIPKAFCLSFLILFPIYALSFSSLRLVPCYFVSASCLAYAKSQGIYFRKFKRFLPFSDTSWTRQEGRLRMTRMAFYWPVRAMICFSSVVLSFVIPQMGNRLL